MKMNLLHNSAEVLLFHSSLWIRQPAYNIWQQIVDRIILREEIIDMIKHQKRNKKVHQRHTAQNNNKLKKIYHIKLSKYVRRIHAYLCSEFIEEVDCKVRNMWLRVEQESCNFADLTFDLHHIL